MNKRNEDEDRMNKSSSGAPLLVGLMIGGLVGAGTMLLLAPQSGSKTREEVKDGAMQIKDRTTETVRGAVTQAKSRAQEVAGNLREKADDLQSQGKDIAIDQLDRVASAAQSRKRSLQNSRNDTTASSTDL